MSSNGQGTVASRISRPRDVPRPRRRYGQWAATLLFLLIAMLMAGWLWQSNSERATVLVVSRPVSAGELITGDMLTTADVAGVANAVPASSLDTIVGQTASVALVEGQVLSEEMLTDAPVPNSEERVIGVELDPTRVPSGLGPGDTVMVIAVPPAGDPSSRSALSDPDVLSEQAIVQRAGRVDGGGTRLALLVPREVANQLAAFGAAGRVAVIQTPIGGDD